MATQKYRKRFCGPEASAAVESRRYLQRYTRSPPTPRVQIIKDARCHPHFYRRKKLF